VPLLAPWRRGTIACTNPVLSLLVGRHDPDAYPALLGSAPNAGMPTTDHARTLKHLEAIAGRIAVEDHVPSLSPG
jgi:hypothetical protein